MLDSVGVQAGSRDLVMMNHVLKVVVAGLLALAMVGCSGPISPRPGSGMRYSAELGEFAAMPRARIGSLPFPGPFTLYAEADVMKLGRHSYSGESVEDHPSEVDRGIVYTRRAGFLDVCHIRNAADTTAYIHARVALALREGWSRMRFRGIEPSVYSVWFAYPDDWDAMGDDVREELSIRIAQRLAFDVMTWHEIITWYGYKSTVVVSEQGSAFTHDDTPSHVVGIGLAGEALRRGEGYDAAMTTLLQERLLAYGAVDHEGLEAALDATKDVWWSTLGGAKRRLLDLGDGDGLVEPWIVEGMLKGEAAVLRVPTLGDVGGRDLRGMYRVEIDPKILEGFAIRSKLEGDPERVVPERDFPVLMEDIAGSLEQVVPEPGDVLGVEDLE